LFHKQVIASPCFAAPPFRKRSRLLRLLGCKRPRNDSAALPIACGQVRYQHSYHVAVNESFAAAISFWLNVQKSSSIELLFHFKCILL
jgi:hypothetical protein